MRGTMVLFWDKGAVSSMWSPPIIMRQLNEKVRYVNEEHLRREVFTQCPSNVNPSSTTLAQHWRSTGLSVVFSGVTFKQARDVGLMLFECWPIVYDARTAFKQHWLDAHVYRADRLSGAMPNPAATTPISWLSTWNTLCMLGQLKHGAPYVF